MTFESKYEINDEVYFYNTDTLKIEKGVVLGISVSFIDIKDSPTWQYYIKPSSKKLGSIGRYIPESLIFKDRDEVFKFAYTITENI